MFNVEIGNTYEIWFCNEREFIGKSVLLKIKGTELIFKNGALESTEIDALRRVA